jgi:hypothetical protein
MGFAFYGSPRRRDRRRREPRGDTSSLPLGQKEHTRPPEISHVNAFRPFEARMTLQSPARLGGSVRKTGPAGKGWGPWEVTPTST